MGDHRFGAQQTFGHEGEGLADVVGVAARSAHHVVRLIVHIVEVEQRGEVGIGRTREEVEAPVVGEELVGELDEAFDRRENEHVEELAAVEFFQRVDGVENILGVDIDELDALGLGGFDGNELLGAVEARLIDVGHHDARGLNPAMNRIIDRPEAHRPHRGEKGKRAARANAHLMHIVPRPRMVLRVVGADDAGNGF